VRDEVLLIVLEFGIPVVEILGEILEGGNEKRKRVKFGLLSIKRQIESTHHLFSSPE